MVTIPRWVVYDCYTRINDYITAYLNGDFLKSAYPQFSSTFARDFPWNKPSSLGVYTPIYGNPDSFVVEHSSIRFSDYILPPVESFLLMSWSARLVRCTWVIDWREARGDQTHLGNGGITHKNRTWGIFTPVYSLVLSGSGIWSYTMFGFVFLHFSVYHFWLSRIPLPCELR